MRALGRPCIVPPSRRERGTGGEDPSPAGRGTGGEDLLKTGERFGLLLVLGALLLSGQRDGWPFRTWRRVSNGPVLAPQGDGWEAAGTFNPSVVRHDGKIVMLYRAQDRTGTSRLAYSTDLVHWTEALDVPVLPGRPGRFDSRVVEPGPAPIVTADGIVLIYNGADDALVYRTGIARFDRADPRRVLSRTDTPVFAPEAAWEKTGQVPNVVFVEGMVRQGSRWLLYYGGADKYVGVAAAATR